MKKIILILIICILADISALAQISTVPAGFNYQAIARDTLGSPKANQLVNIKFTITDQYETSTPWVETHAKTTDQFGLFTAVIGQGTKVGGTAATFSVIDWKAANYYVKIEVQEGANWFLIGKEPLMSVPYAAVSGETLQPVPAGTVVAYFGTTPPSGWLLCDGTAISRTTYANLYAAIGSFCGSGDGSTTFNLPDLRGVFLRGVNGTRSDTIADPDKDNRVASKSGGNTGNNVGSLQNDAFQGHWHSYYTNYTSLTTEGGANRVDEISTSNIGFTPVGRLGQPISDGTSGTPRTTSETRPKNVYVYYIIKY